MSNAPIGSRAECRADSKPNNLSAADLYDLSYGDMADLQFITFLSRQLCKEAPGNRLLDCACGTGDPGLHLVNLFDVTLSDRAEDMIQRVQKKAWNQNVQSIRIERASWEDLPKVFPALFDSVVCAGDALTMISSPARRRASLAGMTGVLVQGGVLYLDFAESYDAPAAHENPTSVIGPVLHCGQQLVVVISERFSEGILERLKTAYCLEPTRTRKLLQIRTHYRPLSRTDLRRDLEGLGFSSIRFRRRPGHLSHLTCVLAKLTNRWT